MDNLGIELPLRDIHLPDAVSWWPLALGWWLAIATVCLLGALIVIIIKKYFKPNLKKQAVQALNKIEKSFYETEDAARCLSELSAFLRRVVLSRKESLKKGGLTGQAWLHLLDQSLDKPEFSQGIGQMLLNGPYQPSVKKEDASQLIQLCRKWINRFRDYD